jgi:5-(carboxyamino)imidazole ribonucleotide mutase
MVASVTVLPVIGVPIKSSNSIDGWDSVLINFTNAKWCSCGYRSIKCFIKMRDPRRGDPGVSDETISKKISDYKNSLNSEVIEKVEKMKKDGWENKFD